MTEMFHMLNNIFIIKSNFCNIVISHALSTRHIQKSSEKKISLLEQPSYESVSHIREKKMFIAA